jgi:hypothetical protein
MSLGTEHALHNARAGAQHLADFQQSQAVSTRARMLPRSCRTPGAGRAARSSLVLAQARHYPLADDLPLKLALFSPDKLNKTLSVATVGEQGGAMLDRLTSVETLLLVATVAVVLAIVCGAI